MKLLYDIGLKAYEAAIALASPFNEKARLMRQGREQQFDKMKRAFAGNQAPVVWFHCASLGEFEQGRPVMEAFKMAYPKYKILLTFFSPSGYEIRKNYTGADYIFYLPLDSAQNAKQFLDIAELELAVFVKYEFWHYYLQELQQRNIPILSVSAIFRPDQVFFKPYGEFNRNMLRRFTHIYTQNKTSLQLLKRIGIKQASIAGDTRFDRVLQTAASVKSIPLVKAFVAGKEVFMVGSSWPADVEVLLPLIQKYSQNINFIIAPHEVNEASITTMMQSLGEGAIRFSKATETDVAKYNVLVIDNIGMLSSLYSYGTYAYIGGAFGKGLHNTLEAAVFGLPLFFGPKYEKFQEAKDLIGIGCAFSVNTSQELLQKFEEVHTTPGFRQSITSKEKTYVQEQAGATAKIMADIKALLKQNT
ncbi:3-deoxy-D-manno-octulosonic acid transferase [Pontibacter cellulosilyticus]|uniref:3-deoxy-D-manno-octulosonic acid transferase n=1 Tax=Pontibacter cellulosilyticus TaxID=1720253 RepID=A0A923N6P6_9BACT|nr:glycosyltransferase N-terminal domain-containing protein [Pontibacter cellulosilyticus]MBC5993231.1 3-deoxy-D-manno-octulosonic acid transferase [Pontibacter cellulosilyticus]